MEPYLSLDFFVSSVQTILECKVIIKPDSSYFMSISTWHNLQKNRSSSLSKGHLFKHSVFGMITDDNPLGSAHTKGCHEHNQFPELIMHVSIASINNLLTNSNQFTSEHPQAFCG